MRGKGETLRVIHVTEGNIRQSHLYLNSHVDFFPKSSFGPSSAKDGLGKLLHLDVVGLPEPVLTDIPLDTRTGKPRGLFRKRSWVTEFFLANEIKAGDSIIIERRSQFRYTVRPKVPSNGRTFAEFFAGIGLVRMGLEAEGWRVAFANDIDPVKRQIYDGHFGDAARHYDTSDIHELEPDRVPNVELATCSFPCTDLSLAGGRRGLRGAESSAFWGFCDIISSMGHRKPPLLLLENVVGFLTSHAGNDFHAAMHALNELGYTVDPFIIDARWFVPQSRPRLFVLCSLIRNEVTNGTPIESRIRPAMLCKAILCARDIKWSIRTLPNPPQCSLFRLQDILDALPNDSIEWWSRSRADYLYGQLSDRHRAVADQMIGRKRWSYGTVFRRVREQQNGVKRSMAELRVDGLAGCLRTPKGGSGRQILFKAGYGRYAARLLTPRECARLMGAAGFRITGSLNHALFGFGDAVCVPAISWISKHYLNPLLDNGRVGSGQSGVENALLR